MSVLGFDVGNDNSYIAAVKSGGIEILDNDYSLRPTPTYIVFYENSRDVGVSAKSKVVTHLETTVFGFKRILGKKYDDPELDKEQSFLPFEICNLASSDIGVKVSYLKKNVVFCIEQLMAMILTKLKIISETKLNSRIRDCVIAVPVYYTDAQRRAMLDAANIADLNALRLMNESTAVALAYGFFKQNFADDPQNVVFVELGNSALTVTACAFSKDKVKILGCVWDDIGGRDFDYVLAQHFVKDFKDKYQLDAMANKKALMRLVLECEAVKKVMSTNSQDVHLKLDCFMWDVDVNSQIRRDQFEKLSVDIFTRIEMSLRKILMKTRLSNQDIHSVEIVGGSSRIPAVKQLIQKVFGREPNSTLNQDEAIARGCALQCAILSPSLKTKDFVIEDIPSYIIRIVWKNMENQDEELDVFSFSDKIPACKVICISINKSFPLEANFIDTHYNVRKIGTFSFGNIPPDAETDGVMKIKIKVCLNIHGIFSLTSAKVVIKSANTVKNMDETEFKSQEERDAAIPAIASEEKMSVEENTQQEKSMIKYHELSINSDIPGLSEVVLKEFINEEKQMIAADIEEKEKANARNALEEFVYETRGKLCYELYNFASENDRKNLLEYLNETEHWLYNNGQLKPSTYTERLEELKNSTKPVIKRYEEWRQRPVVLDEYQQILQKASDAINNCAEQFKDFPSDVENLLEVWQNSKQHLDRCIEYFSKLNKIDDVSMTVDELKISMNKFQTEFQNSFSELGRKIESVKEATQTTFGDGHSQNSEENKEGSMPIQKDQQAQNDLEHQNEPSA